MKYSKAHIPTIDSHNSDNHTLFLSILLLNSQCGGVASEGMDIWYMGLITLLASVVSVRQSIFTLNCFKGCKLSLQAWLVGILSSESFQDFLSETHLSLNSYFFHKLLSAVSTSFDDEIFRH